MRCERPTHRACLAKARRCWRGHECRGPGRCADDTGGRGLAAGGARVRGAMGAPSRSPRRRRQSGRSLRPWRGGSRSAAMTAPRTAPARSTSPADAGPQRCDGSEHRGAALLGHPVGDHSHARTSSPAVACGSKNVPTDMLRYRPRPASATLHDETLGQDDVNDPMPPW